MNPVRRPAGRTEPRNLTVRIEGGRATWWTRALARPPRVGRERTRVERGEVWRHWDPTRSKLAAALVRGWTGRIPQPGERWLYLGAASGTTASHVADLVGTEGRVYSVEFSARPFARLIRVAETYPNLLPLWGDARRPWEYSGDVPLVDGLYADVAQPDQPEIVLENARRFLANRGAALVALKTASMGRHRDSAGHAEEARRRLAPTLGATSTFSLNPWHRGHVFLEGSAQRALFSENDRRPAFPSSWRPGLPAE